MFFSSVPTLDNLPRADALTRSTRPIVPARVFAVLLTAFSISAAALVTVLTSTGMSLAGEFAKFGLLAFAVAAIGLYCHFRRLDWRMSASANAVAFATISLLLCGLVSCVGLRVGFPLADEFLIRGDALLGFDTRPIVHFTAARGWASDLLHFTYNSSGPLCLAAVFRTIARKEQARFWEILTTIVVSMQITALLSVAFPARGGAVSLGLDSLQGYGLPVGAGTYFMDAFDHFRSGTDLLVTLADMNGVVSFPSFHTVMALVVVQGFTASPLRWPAIVWAALTIVSTIPMGGHYFVDLAAGSLVWLIALLLARWAVRGSPQKQRSPEPFNLVDRQMASA